MDRMCDGENSMKIGGIVYSTFPRIHGVGHGIILKYSPASINAAKQVFLARAEVFWVLTGKREWLRADVLYAEKE